MMKSKLPILALLLILPFFLTGCSVSELPLIGETLSSALPGFLTGSGSDTAPTDAGSPDDSGDGGVTIPRPPSLNKPVTLKYWGMWEDPRIIGKVIERYQEENPKVQIDYEDRSVLKPEQYKERIFARADSDLGADIARIHSSWVPRIYRTLSPMPTKQMTAREYADTFYPVASEEAVFDGKIYGFPAYYDGLALIYNIDHFSEIGQVSPPLAWEEFRRLALKFSRYSGEDGEVLVRAGAAMGTATNIEHFSDILGMMWSQAGVDIPADVDSRAAQDALTFYTNFLSEDKVWSEEFPEAVTAFSEGKVSMIFAPTWRIIDLLNANPGLNIGVAPVPQAIAENPVSWASYWMDVVPKSSANADVAWDFIEFMSQEEQQLLMFSEASKLHHFGAPFARVDMADQLTSNLFLKPYVDVAPFAKSAEIAARSGNTRQVSALRQAVTEVLSGVTAEEALLKAKDSL